MKPAPDDPPNIAVLARNVCGHLVPQLVLARAVGYLGDKISMIGAAAIVGADADNPRDKGDYSVSVFFSVRFDTVDALREKPATWLYVPLLIVRADRWDEYWIELVDRDGYVAMSVARHQLGCEINGHWLAHDDGMAPWLRRCVKCGELVTVTPVTPVLPTSE